MNETPPQAHRIGLDVMAHPEGYIEWDGQPIPLTLDLLIRVRSSQGTLIAQMHPNGDVEYGDGYTPTTASRVFWESLTAYWRDMLKRDQLRLAHGLLPQFGSKET